MNYFLALTIAFVCAFTIDQGASASTEEERLTEQAQKYMKFAQYKEAQNYFDQALKLNPKNPSYLVARAECFLFQKRNDAALKDLNQAITICSRSGKSASQHVLAPALENRARVYLLQKKYSEALKDLDGAIKMHPTIGAYRTQGSVYRLQGDYRRAIRASRNAMDLDVREGNVVALSIDARDLAGSYYSQKKTDKAIAILNEALQVIPRDVPLLTTRAEYYEREHKYKEAIADLGIYQTFNSRARQNYAKRASLHEKLGMYNDAIADYTVLIEKEPDRPSNYYDRAKLLEKIGKTKRAAADRAEALRLEKRLAGID